MALIKCPDCGMDVSDAAPACPTCARPMAAQTVSRPVPKSRRGLGGFFWFVVVLLLLWAYFKTKGPDVAEVDLALPKGQQESAQATEQTPQVAQAAVVTMTPGQLYQQYSANEVATDQAIAGKIIQVTAPVKSIDKNLFDSAVLHFATGNEFGEMGVTLDNSQKPRAAKLSQGQVVTVQCKTMRRIMESPMGSDCVFVDLAPDVSTSNASQAPTQGAAAAPTEAPDGPQPAPQGSQEGDPDVSPLSQPNEPAETTSVAVTAPATTAASAPSTVLQKVIDNINGPSFDCSTATSLGARAICGNAKLRQLDRQMAILYYSHTNYGSDPAVRDQQLAWIRSRNQSCVADVVCLTEQYNQRIVELQDVHATAPNSSTQTRVAGSDGAELALYTAAIRNAIAQQWRRPTNVPNASCLVHVVQKPGGTVVTAKIDESCPYDEPTKASVENAVFSAEPLPYKGFESVFQRQIDVTFSP